MSTVAVHEVQRKVEEATGQSVPNGVTAAGVGIASYVTTVIKVGGTLFTIYGIVRFFRG